MLNQDFLRGIVSVFAAVSDQSCYVAGFDLTKQNGYILARGRGIDHPDWQYTPSEVFEELDRENNIVGLLF